MLALAVVEEIERLLQEGTLSQRKIARRLNVSRGTVAAIASGQRGLYGREAESEEDDRRVRMGEADPDSQKEHPDRQE